MKVASNLAVFCFSY